MWPSQKERVQGNGDSYLERFPLDSFSKKKGCDELGKTRNTTIHQVWTSLSLQEDISIWNWNWRSTQTAPNLCAIPHWMIDWNCPLPTHALHFTCRFQTDVYWFQQYLRRTGLNTLDIPCDPKNNHQISTRWDGSRAPSGRARQIGCLQSTAWKTKQKKWLKNQRSYQTTDLVGGWTNPVQNFKMGIIPR